MHSRLAMDDQPCPALLQSFLRKLDAALENFRRFGLEIIVNRVPQHRNSLRLRQRGVIEFDLHIEDVSHARPCHLLHVLRCPDTAADRDPVGHPCHVHSLTLPSPWCSTPASMGMAKTLVRRVPLFYGTPLR